MNKRAGRWFPPQLLLQAVCVGLCPFLAAAQDSLAPGLSPDAVQRTIYFGTDIVPILTKLGCNGGGCHGKATGQNGFRLSLFGFEPEVDYDALVTESRGRRLSTASPHRSLLLLKATSAIPHGGGRRLEEGSDDYRLLQEWIAQGAPAPRVDDPRLQRIEIVPASQILRTNSSCQLQVHATFTDGTTRNVTQQAVYQSNESDIAAVDARGTLQTTTQHGLVVVMARFGEQIATFHGAVPRTDSEASLAKSENTFKVLEVQLGDSAIDRLLLAQWRQLGVVPSSPADDATFLRRVSLDVCGTLPTSDEVTEYLADTRPDKRQRVINRLLERPEYASYFALKWADILQNRGAGYSTSRQRPGTTLFAGWIRDSLGANKPYDQFVTEILTASGSQSENPPAIWYRAVRKSPEYVESVAQAFLGVRIQCAQCHHHPTENWSQADYFGLAAVFSRVGRKGGFADAEVPTDEIIYLKDRGETRHPRTGVVLQPRPLGGTEFSLRRHDDPRQSLAQWMTAADNPFFARTMANRIWAHFMGRGIVHPIDDARSTNPPCNPELLDALAADFVKSGFDVKHLIRTVTGSYAYGLDSTQNPGNTGDTQSFARFYPRRLTAEVLLDSISQVLDVSTNFPGVPAGTRAIDLPDENVAAHFLDVFGRPARMTACECERIDSPALTQGLELVNSTEIQRKLTSETGYARRIAASERSNAELIQHLFLRALARPPRKEEQSAALAFLQAEPDRTEACQSLLWSLLATNEFLFNH
jgi:hypothetical protein